MKESGGALKLPGLWTWGWLEGPEEPGSEIATQKFHRFFIISSINFFFSWLWEILGKKQLWVKWGCLRTKLVRKADDTDYFFLLVSFNPFPGWYFSLASSKPCDMIKRFCLTSCQRRMPVIEPAGYTAVFHCRQFSDVGYFEYLVSGTSRWVSK